MGSVQGVDSEYVYLNSGPLFHIATFMTTLATLHFGGNNVFTRRFDAFFPDVVAISSPC